MADAAPGEGLSVPDHVNLKLDPVTRRGIADFMSRMRIANRSDALRTLIVAGLGAHAEADGSPGLDLARAAYVNATMRGIAAIKASLPALLEAASEKLAEMEG